MLRSQLVDDPASIEAWRPQWDALAVQRGRPFCSPAWVLSWWHHAAPPRSHLRVMAVWDDAELIAVAPFFAHTGRGGLVSYRMLAAPVSARIEPLAKEGAELSAATVFARQLAIADPRPHVVVFEGIPVEAMWPKLIREAWPGSRVPPLHTDMSMAAPTLSLTGAGYDDWFQARRARFRREVRRRRRRLVEKGAVFRLATTGAEIRSGLADFAELHYSRWSWRGGSRALDHRIENMLAEAAEELGGTARFRLWTIEVDGRVLSSQLFVGAGGELAYWLGGFDEEWAALAPSTQAVLAAIEHAWKVGDNRIDFGAGGQEYKYELATGNDVLEWTSLVPHGARYPLTRVQLLPGQLRHLLLGTLSHRVSSEAKDRLKRTLRAAKSRVNRNR